MGKEMGSSGGIYRAKDKSRGEELKRGISGLNICEECGGFCTESVPLIEGLPVNAQVSLMEHSIHENLKKNSYLFREGEPVDSICIIRKGRVKLCRYDSLGREQIVTILADHDIIWEGMFLDGSIYPYSAVCLTNASICQIHRDDFIKVVNDPHAAMNTIILLSKKLHDANERNMLLSTKDPMARLAGFLLYRVDRSIDDDVILKLDDIAASVSLRTETVSRKLREMEREGLIERLGHARIRVLDRDGLKEIYVSQ
ncbi:MULTISPECIES: Crp/Fnr family transcriptional regulator [unclassified Butyrivibrio]|jgi:CRP/FNR family transcriptional regulator|uniref:Crp/Fnr family transcriptional regulator n=1 Tax=unclassified Butyrivibrio TaxID=2639466 RepID=UPI0004143B79|nr:MULTISPECIES: Crp/Fnr family transcriptional regulator [unclassified Butyrivibrio]